MSRHARVRNRVLPGIVVLADGHAQYVGKKGRGKHRLPDDDPSPFCALQARGFCGAAIDDHCVGGRTNGRCFG